MNNSGFLRDLARTAREEDAEEQQRWDRWDRLNDGDLFPEELAELRAEDEMAFEAFRPLGADFNARVVEKIGPLIPAPRPVPIPVPVPEPLPPSPSPLPFPARLRRSVRRTGFVGSRFAEAAALVLMVRMVIPPPPTPPTNLRQIPAIGITDLRSSVQGTRGGDEEQAIPADATPLVAGARFTASAQPFETLPPRVTLDVHCYVSAKERIRKLRRISCAPSAPSESGARDIAGSLPQDLPPGPAILWIVLANSGHQPEIGVIERLPTDQPTFQPTWQALPQPIEVRAS